MDETPAAKPQDTYRLDVEFTGSGSEYFRIWIVNVLLIVVTLSLYWPWAKVRRLRYFMGNTVVNGEPLSFHGDPKKMFKGYVLVAILFGLYNFATKASPTAGLIALCVVAGLWPALFKSSMQFRMANTSWRGLRFHFTGSLRDAYRAMLPIFIPGLFFSLVAAVLGTDGTPESFRTQSLVAMTGGLIVLTISPWLLWNLKQYQHNHYALGELVTEFRAPASAFYKLMLKIFAAPFLLMAVAGVLAAVVIPSMGTKASNWLGFMPIIGVLIFAMYVGFILLFTVYGTSRLQNLVWTQTGNNVLRFKSTLKARDLLWLTVKNWLLMIVTLGLYWPFARIALARLRLEAVSVKTRLSPNALVARAGVHEGDAAGDAAGDFFGFDIGL